ncbi:hypothetical protein PNA2_1591 [Pyrococcus sp. NA2]|uniref:SufD family Fe-S cluster assembly protein n=1 Tax=Pyrococcus sp. (strain NA2) TaxID=342949 RepID=UPI000209A9A5|nr:SufD family Fe-S cluster assembly protein [Pyrococcus sp. NA2]AEC52506.1 hypothetical protein PNA2_1591 [Pyrococcus sp. NA2]
MSEKITPEMLKGLTYQRYGDSPTIKSYTNWKLFEENSPLKLPTEAKGGKVPITGHITLSGREEKISLPKDVKVDEGTLGLSNPKESKILGFHFYALKRAYRLRIKKDLQEPLIIVSHLSRRAFVSHHVSIEVENARVPIVIYDIAENGVKSLVVELIIRNGEVELLNVGRHENLSHYLLRTSLIGKSQIRVFTAINGGRMSHHREDYFLEGEGSKLILRGLPITIGRSADYLTNVLQSGKNSMSDIRVHGFSYKRGWTIHRGVARILESAKNASSGVVSEITIMDEGSLGVSVPMLEVDTDNIEGAFHSSSVKQLDEYALFYLRSRGIDQKETIKLLIQGIGESLSSHLEWLRSKARSIATEVVEELF